MSENERYGICKLCGEHKKLTFEHVPPHKAFNAVAVKKYSPEDSIELMAGTNGRKPWETDGLNGILQQKGMGDYFLCKECNSNTGSWYMSEYTKFAKTLRSILLQPDYSEENLYSFTLEEFYPLKVFKGIMTMFCDINHGCMGDDSLRSFIMDRESTEFDHKKFSVYLYLTKSEMRRIQCISVMHLSNIGLIRLSEISSFPIGLILCIDKPKKYNPPGLMINEFAKYKYDETVSVDFVKLPLLEVNSHFPADFRTKQQIIDCFNQDDETVL